MPVPCYLSDSLGLGFRITQPGSKNGVSARLTIDGKPKPRYRKTDANVFADGVLVFHGFTENKENPL